MAEDRERLYGGRHRAVLDHPDHLRGVNHGTMTVTEITELAPSVTRVSAELDHDGDEQRWFATNPAVRIELEDSETGGVVSRVYTVRAARRSANGIDIDIDIVRHPGTGVVMDWLATLRPGSSARILGPRPHFCPNPGTNAPVALFADETAIPALATIIRDWPEARTAQAWIETPDAAVLADLPTHPGVVVHRLERGRDEPPGTTGRLVEAALRFSGEHAGPVSIWACGEHGEMKRIRDHFRRDRGLAREDVVVFGYWRRLVTSSQIDEERLRRYERALEKNPRMTVLDDFEDSE